MKEPFSYELSYFKEYKRYFSPAFLGMIVVAVGIPAVSTDCPTGPSEILTGSLARWLVPVNDAEALAKKNKEVLQTSIEIPKEIVENFDEKYIFEKYKTLFESAMVT